MYCNIMISWWSTQSRFATLLSSSIACRWVGLPPMESISLNSFVLLEHLAMLTDFSTRNKLLTQKLLKQGYQYHKLCKTFSKFYRRYYDLIS